LNAYHHQVQLEQLEQQIVHLERRLDVYVFLPHLAGLQPQQEVVVEVVVQQQ
jgi:hypothetical protein